MCSSDLIGATVAGLAAQCRASFDQAGPRAAATAATGAAGAIGAADSVQVVDARGPGFGVASDEGDRAAGVARDTEGLLLDPVYTAKAFAVVVGLLRAGFTRPIVFWHTGGLPAALHHLAPDRSSPCRTPR